MLPRAIRSIFPGVLLSQVVPKVEVVPVTRIKPVLEMKPLDFKDMVGFVCVSPFYAFSYTSLNYNDHHRVPVVASQLSTRATATITTCHIGKKLPGTSTPSTFLTTHMSSVSLTLSTLSRGTSSASSPPSSTTPGSPSCGPAPTRPSWPATWWTRSWLWWRSRRVFRSCTSPAPGCGGSSSRGWPAPWAPTSTATSTLSTSLSTLSRIEA